MEDWKYMMTSKDLEILTNHYEVMSKVYDRINNYHQRPLHEAQEKMARALFAEHKKIIMSQWGRSGGKTECVLFIAWVFALLNPATITYIVCPEVKQGRKIYWIPRRLQDYGPPEYLADIRESELAIVLTNGSKIIIDGSENYSALRGIKPHLVFYDEFQDHSKEFDLEVMRPNLFAKRASLVVTGTPPKSRDSYYVEFHEQLQKDIKRGDKTRAYFEFSTYVNPAQDKQELDKLIRQLRESGNGVIADREYMGRLVFGGADAVFPKWSYTRHVRKAESILGIIPKGHPAIKYYTIFDPGTTSCFAVLFAAYNSATCQVFLLDEIYETDRLRIDSKTIFEATIEKEKAIRESIGDPGIDFRRYYDEAGAWFQREVQKNFHVNMTPTYKNSRDKNADISLIRLVMAEPNTLFVASRCKSLIWEIESYVTDEKGKITDKNDHLVDCLRYFVGAANVKFVSDVEKTGIASDRGPSYITVQGKKIIKHTTENWGGDTIIYSLEDGYESDNY